MKAIDVIKSYLENNDKDAFDYVNDLIKKQIASGSQACSTHISVYLNHNTSLVLGDYMNAMKRYYELQGFNVEVTPYEKDFTIVISII